MEYITRNIEEKDDKQVENLIRRCLIEYGANKQGTAWQDPDLCRFSTIYNDKKNRYWVAVNTEGNVIAGVGIGEIKGADKVCELQKMYCEKEYRGLGIAQKLLDIALNYAKKYYTRCYLETLPNMTRAQRFYEKNGFTKTTETIFYSEHFACDVKYIKNL